MAGQLNDMKSYVFWDMEDFPLPEGHDVKSFRMALDLAFKKMSFAFDPSSRFWVYGKKKSEEEVRRLELEGFTYVGIDDKYWRTTKILLDIQRLAYLERFSDRVLSSFMIIAKPNSDDKYSDFYRITKDMSFLHFHTILVLPRACETESAPVPWTRAAWFWDELLGGGTYVPMELLIELHERQAGVGASSTSPPTTASPTNPPTTG